MSNSLTNSVKEDLHIRSDAKNEQIAEAIATAKTRMRMMGVERISDADPTTAQCVKLYCRFYFNFQGEAERYFSSFEYMANAMALSGDYRSSGGGAS